MPGTPGLETGIPLREAEPLLLASIFFTLFAAINEVRRETARLRLEHRHPVTVTHVSGGILVSSRTRNSLWTASFC